jgi:hypothetical protein
MRAFRRKPQVTTRTTPTVNSAFMLRGFDEPQLAGEYRIDLAEESFEGASGTAWRRVAIFIHKPAISAKGSTRQMASIELASLEAALDKDRRQS